MLSEEILLKARPLLPTHEQIAAELGVSRVTVTRVLTGKSNCKKVVDYVLRKASEEVAKIRRMENIILKKAG